MFGQYTTIHPLSKVLTIITLLALGAVVIFGLSMSMNMDGSLGTCPLMSHHNTFCPMGMLEHIASWQELFRAIIISSTFAFLSSVIIVFLGLLTLLPRIDQWTALLYIHKRRNSILKRFDYLVLNFSRGILNPKPY